MDGRVYLKIKLKSLGEESRIIRHEERKRKVPGRYVMTANRENEESKVIARGARANLRQMRSKRRGRDWYPKSVAELHQLQLHRRNVVSREARLTHIAYAYIRGRDLVKTDSCKGLLTADWERIGTMIKKYGSGKDMKEFHNWMVAAYPDRFMILASDPQTAVVAA
jgi:hypothetical protein